MIFVDRLTSISASERETPEPLPPLRDVIKRLGLSADKRLAQHFLLDPSILERIARAAAPLVDCTILEIGPGPGGLTRALLKAGAERVVAVERDARCIAALEEIARHYDGRLVIVEADARTFDPTPLAAEHPIKVVANLPYNVGTQLLLGWLHRIELFERLTLMFQKEVALRLSASPNSADWGRLSVLTQSLCRVRRHFDLPPSAFVPPPKVHSTLVELEPRQDRPTPTTIRRLSAVTAAAFGQRRKMLRASLKGLDVPSVDLLRLANIDPERRAETLTLEEFLMLAASLESLRRADREEGETD